MRAETKSPREEEPEMVKDMTFHIFQQVLICDPCPILSKLEMATIKFDSVGFRSSLDHSILVMSF